MDKDFEQRPEKKQRKKIRKIRTKLLLLIVPIVAITIIALVGVSAYLTRKEMTEMAREQLDSSISNQGDNIESWLDQNLEYFSSVKNIIENSHPDEATLQTILDANYGYNKNATEGLYIGTASGRMFQASECENIKTSPQTSEWFKQGLSRVNMNFGPAYTDAEGNSVISATGILKDGSDEVKVIGADVKLNHISVIVNSGVKMKDAASILVDTQTNTILSARDAGKINTQISESDSDALLAGIARAIKSGDTSADEIGRYMVSFKEIQGTDWMLVSYVETSIIQAPLVKLINTMVIVGAAALILVVVLILVAVSRVVAPLSDITKHIKSMSEGDFTIDVDIKSNDEIGLMGDKIGEFVNSMRGMIRSINEESDKLREESDNSDNVSRSMYDASQTQGEAMKQLNETVDQLANAVNDIAENATTLAQIVTDTRENSEKADAAMKETVDISKSGKEDMKKLHEAMRGIQVANNELVDSIHDVGTASEEITKIVGMIGEIAEETNLLSLNASIEAARAGEAGRGFAVVASQIGSLAHTSADSASNISALIEKVHDLINNAVGQANRSAESIEENGKMIEVAVETFDKIYNNIQDSNVLINAMIENVEQVNEVATNVAAISEEQAASAEEILATSNNMVEQADNITKSSQDVADNSHELANTSETLTNYVQRFKI